MRLSRHHGGWLVTGLGALLIAGATLFPQPTASRTSPSPRGGFSFENHGTTEILGNLLLFVPLGIGLRLLRVSPKSIVAIAATLSVVVELLQASLVSGREGSIRDVLTNTSGALAGAWLAGCWKRLAFPSHLEGRRLRWLGAACWLLALCGEAAMLQREFPATIWYGQWAPEGVFPATFSGRVRGVRIDSVDLPGGRLPDPERARAALRSDRFTLLAEITTGDPAPDLSSVFSIFDGEQREIILVGQRGTDLLVRYRTRAAAIGLRPPAFALPGAFALPPGEPLRISVAFDRGVIALAATSSTGTLSREVSVTPAWGWSLLLPFDVPIGPFAPLLGAFWIAALAFPMGYWTGRGIPMRSAVAIGGSLLCLGTALPPLLFGLPSASALEWISGTTGLAVGVCLGRRGLSPGHPR